MSSKRTFLGISLASLFLVYNIVFIILIACKVHLPVMSELLNKNLWKESMYNTQHLFYDDLLPTLWIVLWWIGASGIYIFKAIIQRMYDSFITWLNIIADFVYPFGLFTFFMFMSGPQNFSNVFYLICFCVTLVLLDWVFMEADYNIGKVLFGLLLIFLVSLLLFFINYLYLINPFFTVFGGILLALLLGFVIAGLCGATGDGNPIGDFIIVIIRI